MEELTFDELVSSFVPAEVSTFARESVIADIEDRIRRYSPTHLVLFRNLQVDSSAFGQAQILAVGPRNTHKTLDELEGGWLNDLPSQRQYPTHFCVVREGSPAGEEVTS